MIIVEGGLDDPRVIELLHTHLIRARALYARHGFVECAPFGDYVPDRNSVFMTLVLPSS